jgi:hypothetical protein
VLLPTATLRPTATFTPTSTPTATPNWGATATVYVDSLTATASALATPVGRYEDAASGIAFDVPDGWQQPRPVNANILYLTDGTAQIFIYRGDAAYFDTDWGIPADETDLTVTADALRERAAATGAVSLGTVDQLIAAPLRRGKPASRPWAAEDGRLCRSAPRRSSLPPIDLTSLSRWWRS